MNIILFGFKSCGKTTIGKMLSLVLGFRFIDMDRVVEKEYFSRYKKRNTIREIYKILGETAFRKLEHDVILSLIGLNNTVVATGGGSILERDNQLIFRRLGKLVYLKANKTEIRKRIFEDGFPAFLNIDEPSYSFEVMYRKRVNIYKNIGGIIINTNNKSREMIIKTIVDKVVYG